MSNETNFFVPDNKLFSSMKGLCLPGESFNSVFNQLAYVLSPESSGSIWIQESKTTVVHLKDINPLDKYFPDSEKSSCYDVGDEIFHSTAIGDIHENRVFCEESLVIETVTNSSNKLTRKVKVKVNSLNEDTSDTSVYDEVEESLENDKGKRNVSGSKRIPKKNMWRKRKKEEDSSSPTEEILTISNAVKNKLFKMDKVSEESDIDDDRNLNSDICTKISKNHSQLDHSNDDMHSNESRPNISPERVKETLHDTRVSESLNDKPSDDILPVNPLDRPQPYNSPDHSRERISSRLSNGIPENSFEVINKDHLDNSSSNKLLSCDSPELSKRNQTFNNLLRQSKENKHTDYLSEQTKEQDNIPPVMSNENPQHNDLNSDEEIIASSQDPKLSLQFNLSSGKKNSITVGSTTLIDKKSGHDTESRTSQSLERADSDWELQIENEMKLSKSRVEKLMSKLTNVMELINEADNPLHVDDITEEDLFIIQCPLEIDPKSFIRKDIILDGTSSVLLEIDGKLANYDLDSIEEKTEKKLNLLLPNRSLSDLHLGSIRFAGNMILSASLNADHSKSLSESVKDEDAEGMDNIYITFEFIISTTREEEEVSNNEAESVNEALSLVQSISHFTFLALLYDGYPESLTLNHSPETTTNNDLDKSKITKSPKKRRYAIGSTDMALLNSSQSPSKTAETPKSLQELHWTLPDGDHLVHEMDLQEPFKSCETPSKQQTKELGDGDNLVHEMDLQEPFKSCETPSKQQTKELGGFQFIEPDPIDLLKEKKKKKVRHAGANSESESQYSEASLDSTPRKKIKKKSKHKGANSESESQYSETSLDSTPRKKIKKKSKHKDGDHLVHEMDLQEPFKSCETPSKQQTKELGDRDHLVHEMDLQEPFKSCETPSKQQTKELGNGDNLVHEMDLQEPFKSCVTPSKQQTKELGGFQFIEPDPIDFPKKKKKKKVGHAGANSESESQYSETSLDSTPRKKKKKKSKHKDGDNLVHEMDLQEPFQSCETPSKQQTKELGGFQFIEPDPIDFPKKKKKKKVGHAGANSESESQYSETSLDSTPRKKKKKKSKHKGPVDMLPPNESSNLLASLDLMNSAINDIITSGGSQYSESESQFSESFSGTPSKKKKKKFKHKEVIGIDKQLLPDNVLAPTTEYPQKRKKKKKLTDFEEIQDPETYYSSVTHSKKKEKKKGSPHKSKKTTKLTQIDKLISEVSKNILKKRKEDQTDPLAEELIDMPTISQVYERADPLAHVRQA